MSTPIRIVDLGRGPPPEGQRLTVLDVFYYLHRNHEWDFIQRALPSLTRPEFDAVLAYGADHCDELVEQDRRAEEFIRRGQAHQPASSLAGVPPKERLAKL